MSITRIVLFFIALIFAAAVADSFLSSVDWNNSALKALAIPVATPLLRFFNNAGSAFVLSMLLLSSAIMLAVWYWATRVKPIANALEALTAEVDLKAAGAGDPARALGEALGASPLVRREWALFRARAQEAEGGGGAPRARLSDFVTIDGLERHGLLRQQMAVAPEYFLGVGLILTFCSLVSGLYFASKGVISPDLSEARQSLQLLLNALSFKFLTSIVGLASALLLTAVSRQASVRVGLALDDLCLTVDAALARQPGAAAPTETRRHRISVAGAGE